MIMTQAEDRADFRNPRASYVTGGRWGATDEELATYPTVYRPGLFAGKTVLVSGAGSGLGKATAYLFARLGGNLVICGRNPDKLAGAETWIRSFGVEVDVHSITIRDPDMVAAMMDAVWAKTGGLDVLINNAGGQFAQKAIDFSVKGWKAVIDTNLSGTWFMMQAAARRWRDQGRPGAVVNIVADFWRGMPDAAHTCAARAAVAHLSKTVAVEWAPYDIRVNGVAPGTLETEGFANYPPETSAGFQYSNPMKRTGHAMDCAEACVYLAGASGKFVTGEVLTVDGGQQLWGDVWMNARPDYFKLKD
jgi:citronellol/citronellal dehydrogenase